MNARQLCERYLRSVTQRDVAAFAALFAEDAVFEQPFVLPGRPSRRQGRDVLREAMREGWSRTPVHFEEACNVVVQATGQGDGVFVELEFRGTNTVTGATFRLPVAISLQARDGLISRIVEYFNPIEGAKIAGATEAVAAHLLASSREASGQGSALTPRQVFERIQRATLEKDPRFADLYAEDGVHEFPFAPPGRPRRICGRENIRAFLNRAASGAPMEFKEFGNVRVHDTMDSGALIAEYDLHGVVTKTGAPFVFSYILLLTVRNGEISLLRDYMDTMAMAAALGAQGA